jgi:hypothetical protein
MPLASMAQTMIIIGAQRADQKNTKNTRNLTKNVNLEDENQEKENRVNIKLLFLQYIHKFIIIIF